MKPSHGLNLQAFGWLVVAGCAPSVPGTPAAWEDPSSKHPEALVFRAWQDYIRSKEGRLAFNAGTPSLYWMPEEQKKWPMYDLAGFYVPEGASPEVISITLTRRTDAPEYEIVTRFTVPDSDSGRPRTVVTIAVSAIQAEHRWLLANVLPRRTRSWSSDTVGQIRYFVEPNLRFNRSRADRAVAFVDSLAIAFGVPKLGPLDYYVASSVDAALAAIGVTYPTNFGSGGGFAKPVNRQIFAAVPAWGEEYRHELTHLVLRPLFQGSTMSTLTSEGLATWLGGTGGMSFQQAARALRRFLAQRPAITLDSALAPGGLPQNEAYAAGAVLCEMVFQEGRVPALKQFLISGPGPQQLRSALERLLQRPWPDIRIAWRASVDHVAGAVEPPHNAALQQPRP